jgi:hypothetical protein
MLRGKIVAGHVKWPAKIIPLWHGEEGEGDVVVHGVFRVSGDTIGGMEPFF